MKPFLCNIIKANTSKLYISDLLRFSVFVCVRVCVCVYDSQMETLCDRVFIGDNVLTIGSTEVS